MQNSRQALISSLEQLITFMLTRPDRAMENDYRPLCSALLVRPTNGPWRAISSLHMGGAGQVDPGPLLTNFLILILCQKGQRKK